MMRCCVTAYVSSPACLPSASSQERLYACMQALQHYTEITTRFPSLAITERARIKRALLRYETGAVQQAIAELEDEEVALRGYAEVHAALAAILYTDRPEQRQRAEGQWELANEFDHRYGDLQHCGPQFPWQERMVDVPRGQQSCSTATVLPSAS